MNISPWTFLIIVTSGNSPSRVRSLPNSSDLNRAIRFCMSLNSSPPPSSGVSIWL